MQYLRANTEVIVTVGPFVDVGDGFTPQTDITLGGDEAELIKHGLTSVVNISGATWAPVTDCRGYYSLTLTTGYTDTEGLLVVIVQDDSDCLPVKQEYMVLSEAAWDSLYAAKDAGFMDVNIKTVGRADTQETEANNLESACAAYSVTRGLTGTALPNAAADAVLGLPISDAGGLDLDTLLAELGAANIPADVDTLLTRVTAAVALASVCTEGRLSELDAANVPADIDTLLTRIAAAVATEAKQDIIDAIVDDLKAALILVDTTIESANRTTTSCQMVTGSLEDDACIGCKVVLVGDAGTGYVSRTITDYVAVNNVVTWTPALAQDPIDGGQIYIIPGDTKINVTADAILIDTNELQADWANGGRLDLLIDAIKAKTDNQPAGIPKNVALSNFEFLMVLSSDHITPATGKTLTEEISKDGGAFAACTNAAAEISAGVYKINLTQDEMNADIITLKFTEGTCDQRTITIKTSA